ncbi:hypothetical protein LTR78_004866 [Recurvomyces mirabilis]|uniref:AB hydrolase-1 domain-containing protein n=1 Tax=Recurvomyces mirabilis TaxID=574656 RepID=A0AAE0WP25_9PEZI|nr:hypothetical protein LTR78_004866 [Recurvomyces mirabilis]KAK5158037.1 hypothetical protein LTS14_003960 [Recurvomyces mirabilis]
MQTNASTILKHVRGGNSDAKQCVVFTHGWGCHAADYHHLFDVLKQHSPDFQYLAVDLPGHGSPKDICPEANVTSFAISILETVRQLNLREVYLAGHSMGCRLISKAWQQARQTHGVEIKGLIFLDGSSFKLRPKSEISEDSLTQQEKSLRRIQLFQTMFSDNTPEDFELDFLQHLGSLDKTYIDGLRKSYMGFDQDGLEDVLAKIGRADVPLLSLQSTDISADNERVQLKAGESSKWIELVQEKVPYAEQRVISRSGHFPHVDQPEEVAALIIEFVAKHGSP